MPKLSEIDPTTIEIVKEAPKPPAPGSIRLADLKPDSIEVVYSPQAKDPGLIERGSKAVLDGVAAAGRAVDSISGAPARAALDKLVSDPPTTEVSTAGMGVSIEGRHVSEAPEEIARRDRQRRTWDAVKAFTSQFAEDPRKAPSGAAIARKMGVSSAPIPIPASKGIQPGTSLKFVPSDAAGFGIDVLADPTIAIPAGAAAKAVGGVGLKATRTAAGIGAKAGSKAARAVLGDAVFETARNKFLTRFSGVPEDKIAEYMLRPVERVNAARPLPEIGQDIFDSVNALRDRALQGSRESMDILERTPGRLESDDVADILAVARQELARFRTGKAKQGVGKSSKAGYGEIQSVIRDLEQATGTRREAAPEIPTLYNSQGAPIQARKTPDEIIPGSMDYQGAKRILVQLQDVLDNPQKAGEISGQAVRSLRNIRGEIRGKLGQKVPEFDAKMQEVASDFQLLDSLKEAGLDNQNTITSRLQTSVRKEGRLLDRDLMDRFGERMGKNFFQEAEDRLIFDSFFKDGTRGSRNTVTLGTLGAATGGAIGGSTGATVGAAIGAQAGHIIDKSGGQMAKGILDRSRGFSAPPPKTGGPTGTSNLSKGRVIPDRTKSESALKAAQVYSVEDNEGLQEAIRRRLKKGKQ